MSEGMNNRVPFSSSRFSLFLFHFGIPRPTIQHPMLDAKCEAARSGERSVRHRIRILAGRKP
jgi:hypothetical protein